MSYQFIFDVIIIGGGPGGSSLASYLAMAGLKCAVFEGEVFPRPHVGESLVPASTRVFKEINFLDKMEAAGFPHKYGAAWTTVTGDKEYEVDWEGLRTDLEFEQIAERFFSPQENAMLHALPAMMKFEGFYNCWTRKEAYIKARGEGLSLPLDQFDVSLTPSEPARLLSFRGDPKEAARWSLYELSPGPGYVAALAVEGHGWHLKYWQLLEVGSACFVQSSPDAIRTHGGLGGLSSA